MRNIVYKESDVGLTIDRIVRNYDFDMSMKNMKSTISETVNATTSSRIRFIMSKRELLFSSTGIRSIRRDNTATRTTNGLPLN